MDANGHTTRYAYDRDGLLVTLTEAGGQVSRMAYDPAHNLVRFTNAKGNAWDYTYDALNRRVGETDPLHHATHYDYDAVGNRIRTTDANSIATRSDFDPLNRLIAVIQNDRPGAAPDQQTNVTTRYTYDPVGNLITTVDANGEATRFSYDLLDRLTNEVNPLGHTWRYAYDAVGNPTARTDAKGQLTRYRYDADDLLTTISYPDSTGVSFGYDAVHNQTTMTDQLGLTRNEYDALNRLAASTNHVGQRVGYRYDPVGNRTAMIYPDGRTVRYAYDPTNFAVRVTDPDGNVFTVTRDPTHNVVKVGNPNATTADYDIDAAERLTAVRNLTSQNPHEIIANFTYTLDAVGNRTRTQAVYRWRKPTQLTSSYTYDPLYRLTRSDDSESHFTTYSYDAVGNRTREVTNDDPTLVRKIDTTTTEYTYDAANQLVGSLRADEPRGNADRTAQTAQALRAFTHEVEAQAGHHIDAATAQALLDQANVLIGALDGSSPPSVDETATALAALESAVETAGSQGQIDNDGTVNSLVVKLRHADDANAARGPELFATLYDYDLNGNRIRRTAANDDTGTTRDWLKTEYEYDFENRLTHVQDFHTPGNGSWLSLDETFLKYDGYGRVFRRQHDQHIGGGGDQQWTDYVYDGLDPIAEYDNPSPQYTNYYRSLGHILSQHDFKSQQSPAGTLSYYHYDGLDSVVGMTKQLGQSVHNYRYNDYGIILDTNGHAADASNFSDPHNHYTYTGQEWDEQIELFHFYAREYDPAAGVWLQQDPYRGQLSDPKTLHRYGYVGESPIQNVDMYGFQTGQQTCGLSGWNDSTGLFTQANCIKLQSGDLVFTQQWYNSLAQRLKADGLSQGAANMEYFLSGAGGELQLPSNWVKTNVLDAMDLWGNLMEIEKWHTRRYSRGLCNSSGTYADLVVTPEYWKFAFGGASNQQDVAAAMGSFRIDVEVNVTSVTPYWRGKQAQMQVHVTIFDVYNWNHGQSVQYPLGLRGNVIRDDWANSLSQNGMAANFVVRGDYTYSDTVDIWGGDLWFDPGAEPPGDWVPTSCTGSQFDVDAEGPGKIDYCGKPMRN